MARALPARIDPELYAYLKDVDRRIKELESTGSELIVVDDEGAAQIADAFEPIPETTVVLAGVGETEDTEDAWTTLVSGAPSGARYAKIQFYMVALDGNADGYMEWRTDSSGPATRMNEINPGTGDAESNTQISWDYVTLNAGAFQYYTGTSAGSLDWEVRYIGYVL